MKVGVNTLFLLPGEVGGSETYLVETLAALLRVASDLELVLFTAQEGHAALFPRFGSHPRVAFQPLEFRAARRPVRILREQFALARAARRWRLDALWSPGYTGPLACPCPHVLSILDLQYRRFPESLRRTYRWASDALIRAGARRADRVLAISEFSRGEILRFTRAPAGRVSVTPLGVDDAFERDAGAPDAPRPYLLCVAHTHPHKNVDALARAYTALQRERPHHLVLVGGPRRGEAAVRAALDGAIAPARIHRRERLDRAALIRLYQGAELFVFPSRYEGFGLPVLEAMRAGTPVLTTRCGAIPEIGGDAVRYFDPDTPGDLAQALRMALDHPDADQVRRARERARRFTWERTARLTLAALGQAAGAA